MIIHSRQRVALVAMAAALATVAACASSTDPADGSSPAAPPASSAAAPAPTASAAGSAAAGSASSAAASGAPVPGVTGKNLGSVVFSSYGGAYSDAIDKTWAQPFSAANPGTTVTMTGPPDFGKMKAMVQAGNTTWDIIEIGGEHAFDNEADLFEPLDCTIITACDQAIPDVQNTKYRIADNITGTALAYNTDKFAGDPPTSWADFFDLKKYPGMRTLPQDLGQGTFEIALLADGVAPKDLYPLDVPRALKKLDTIKNNIVWWNTVADSVQYLSTGQAVMGAILGGRVYDLKVNDNLPFDLTWNQGIVYGTYMAIPKGAPNAAAAQQLIAYATSAEENGKFGLLQPVGSSNAKSTVEIPQDLQKWLPSFHLDEVVGLNTEYWSKNVEAVTHEFQAWQAK